MQPIDQRRYPDEPFYFQKGELMASPECLQGNVPQVEVIKGDFVVAQVRRRNGQQIGRAHHLGWNPYFKPGEALLEVGTGDEEAVARPPQPGDEYYSYQLPHIGGKYVVTTGDLLVTKRIFSGDKWDQPDDVVIVPADVVLPGVYGEVSYQPLGVITTESKLISWGMEGSYARWLVEISVANKWANDAISLSVLNSEVGDSRSLIGSLSCSSLATAYLAYFRDQYGEDFMPTKDPDWRWGEFSDRFDDPRFQDYLAFVRQLDHD